LEFYIVKNDTPKERHTNFLVLPPISALGGTIPTNVRTKDPALGSGGCGSGWNNRAGLSEEA
jgi:hypothetical protein